MTWDAVQKQAMKILGEGATVPDFPSTCTKASTDFDKTFEEFKTAREVCGEKVLAMDNANSALVNAVEQFRAKIERNSFEFDPKKDLKKIDQARKVLLTFIDDGLKACKTNDKNLDELNRHLVQFGKYKPS